MMRQIPRRKKLLEASGQPRKELTSLRFLLVSIRTEVLDMLVNHLTLFHGAKNQLLALAVIGILLIENGWDLASWPITNLQTIGRVRAIIPESFEPNFLDASGSQQNTWSGPQPASRCQY
jgi:hypothetical protein